MIANMCPLFPVVRTLSFLLMKEQSNAELPAPALKLIHSGKVLKDDQTIESCGIKTNDFLVVMVTKPKKAAPAPASEPASAPPLRPFAQAKP